MGCEISSFGEVGCDIDDFAECDRKSIALSENSPKLARID